MLLRQILLIINELMAQALKLRLAHDFWKNAFLPRSLLAGRQMEATMEGSG